LPDRELKPGESADITAPALVNLGTRSVRLQQIEEAEPLESLPAATLAPGSGALISSLVQATFAQSGGQAMEPNQLISWIQTLLGLLHSAAGSDDFYAQAARALVELVKLDSGRILFRMGDRWDVKTVQAGPRLLADSSWRPSSRVMANLLREKKTSWQVPDAGAGASTRGIDAVVAAPIVDRKGEVIGALYGERRQVGGQVLKPISQLEAMLVEVLASGVAAGLSRVEHEQAALNLRLQMEQHFGKRLATKLNARPELLEGRDTEISILFCDIRGFSRISEKLGAAKTVEWVSDVMGVLSQCVEDSEGVIIDFVGDELLAIWGAPEDQLDHAMRACRTALSMFANLAALNERWQPILGEPCALGIGINSGTCQVGNVGSKLKVKYGAMGNNVNLASRVQGATKHLKASLLITDATREGLTATSQSGSKFGTGDSFSTRRLCQVRVVNIAKPVTLYELTEPNKPRWNELKAGYEEALSEFTRGEFRQACRILGRLILDHPNDGPSLLLLSRAVGCLVEKPVDFDGVMVLAGK
jgi:adenylate cyclase